MLKCVILVLSKMNQTSKVVNTFLLEVHVSCSVEVRTYHTNCRLTFENFIHYNRFLCTCSCVSMYIFRTTATISIQLTIV